MRNSFDRIKSAIITMSIGFGVNIALFIVKLYVGLASNSLAIMGDALNNLGDSIAVIIAVIGFALVKKRGDGVEYGYGRMEYVADFLMAVIVCIVGAAFIYSAVERLVLPYLMTFTWLFFGIIAGTALVKVGLGFFYRMRNKNVDSGVLRAASIDSFTDVGVTVMSLIGFSLNRYSALRIDAVFGLVISAIMIINGIKLLVSSVKTLMGRRLKGEEEEKIRDICLSEECVREVKRVERHDYGAEISVIVVEAVFTNEVEFGIIKGAVERISGKLREETGYIPKICIADDKVKEE